ncbi:hypothetical protein IEQ34_000128 [Dendrobium chrysotoxum]|uniref:Uncharacterized protein n=1 Tax=Dendrobium chrysotoxum TaxID=161865 RepID=A0AAV7HT35_DENCH|nr:hypothetical protein IEQ34_000128 [Dendrobium chrysotoxum]
MSTKKFKKDQIRNFIIQFLLSPETGLLHFAWNGFRTPLIQKSHRFYLVQTERFLVEEEVYFMKAIYKAIYNEFEFLGNANPKL